MWRPAVIVGPFILALATVTGPAGAATGGPPAELGTNGAATPALHWGPCPDGSPEGYQCTTAEVPLSYRDPSGRTIRLGLGRLPAVDQEHRLGSIFVNPGGPGGFGRFPPELSPRLHQRFDIVGFDPRGVGSSTQLRCFDTDEQAEAAFYPPFPITEAQQQEAVESTRRGTEACAANAGPILGHMSTANVARDMELLRRAVGDQQLNYYGVSYGTHLGEVYLNMFGDRAGAVALDAVLDPVEWTNGYPPLGTFDPVSYRVGSFTGAQDALESFLDACEVDHRCAFREPGADLTDKFGALLDFARQRPIGIPQPDGTVAEVDYQTLVSTTLGSLYFAGSSADLAVSLQQLSDAIGGRARAAGTVRLLELAGRLPTYQSTGYQGYEAFPAVTCTDSVNPDDTDRWQRAARRADRVAEGFGASWTYASLACASWPVSDSDRYAGPWNRPTATPTLVLGNSAGDPATPYEDARRTANLLADARLLTLDSFGHGAFGGLSGCIDGAVDRYFLARELPAEGTVCQPDQGPFDPIAEGAANRVLAGRLPPAPG